MPQISIQVQSLEPVNRCCHVLVTHIFTQNLNDTDVKCSDINSEITERNVSS